MKAVSEHDTTAWIDVGEADRTLKRLHVLHYSGILGGNQSIIVRSFTRRLHTSPLTAVTYDAVHSINNVLLP